jgi:hypothetical protein
MSYDGTGSREKEVYVPAKPSAKQSSFFKVLGEV